VTAVRVILEAYTSASKLAGKRLRIPGHEDRQDGAAGDDIKVLPLKMLFTVLRLSNLLPNLLTLRLNTPSLPLPMQLSDLPLDV